MTKNRLNSGDQIILRGIIAAGLVALQAFATWAIIYTRLPEGNNDAFMFLLGILSSNVGIIIGYYFVGNANSRQKDAVMQDMLGQQTQLQYNYDKQELQVNPGDKVVQTQTAKVVRKKGRAT